VTRAAVIVDTVERGLRAGRPRAEIEAEVADLLRPAPRAPGAGRKAAKATTPDGRLVARAAKRAGSMAALATLTGVHASTLSRALHGELRDDHRAAIQMFLTSTHEPAVLPESPQAPAATPPRKGRPRRQGD